MNKRIKVAVMLAVLVAAGASMLAVRETRAQAAPTKSYWVMNLATNYHATVIHGTNSATGTILNALPAGQVYTKIVIRPTGAAIALGFGESASTNGTPYGTGTNWTWEAADPIRGPFLTNSITARDVRGATNATSSCGVEAWSITWQ